MQLLVLRKSQISQVSHQLNNLPNAIFWLIISLLRFSLCDFWLISIRKIAVMKYLAQKYFWNVLKNRSNEIRIRRGLPVILNTAGENILTQLTLQHKLTLEKTRPGKKRKVCYFHCHCHFLQFDHKKCSKIPHCGQRQKSPPFGIRTWI